MNERREKLIRTREKDDATMNFVSRQAQEAILDPNLPESYKDYVLEAAIEAILKIADRKAKYRTETSGNQSEVESGTIYEAK